MITTDIKESHRLWAMVFSTLAKYLGFFLQHEVTNPSTLAPGREYKTTIKLNPHPELSPEGLKHYNFYIDLSLWQPGKAEIVYTNTLSRIVIVPEMSINFVVNATNNMVKFSMPIKADEDMDPGVQCYHQEASSPGTFRTNSEPFSSTSTKSKISTGTKSKLNKIRTSTKSKITS